MKFSLDELIILVLFALSLGLVVGGNNWRKSG